MLAGTVSKGIQKGPPGAISTIQKLEGERLPAATSCPRNGKWQMANGKLRQYEVQSLLTFVVYVYLVMSWTKLIDFIILEIFRFDVIFSSSSPYSAVHIWETRPITTDSFLLTSNE
jgi:hypothetical protein